METQLGAYSVLQKYIIGSGTQKYPKTVIKVFPFCLTLLDLLEMYNKIK